MDQEEEKPVYAAWHIPCYATFNCPEPEKDDSSKGKNLVKDAPVDQLAGSPIINHWNLDSPTDWLTFLFLWSIVIVSLAGVCLVVGSMFVRECRLNRWYLRRPLNHFILSMMASDVLMALVAIPIHIYYLLGDQEVVLFPASTCSLTLFVHLVSVSVKSWSIAAFILLLHFHEGLIPMSHSLVVVCWVWLASVLLVVPVVVFEGDFVDLATCTVKVASSRVNWTLVYTTLVPYILPALVVNPILIKWTTLRQQTTIKRDISNDYLATDAEQEETLKERRLQLREVIICEEANQVIQDDDDSSMSCLQSDNLSYDLSSRVSKGTVDFLSSDNDFAKILLSLSTVHILTWGPFFVFMLVMPCLTDPVIRMLSYLVAWLGYIESAIIPIIIFILSTFVRKILTQTIKDLCSCCSNQPPSPQHQSSITTPS